MENRQQNIELAKDEQIVYQKVIKDNTYLMVIAIAIMLFSIGSSFYLIVKFGLLKALMENVKFAVAIAVPTILLLFIIIFLLFHLLKKVFKTEDEELLITDKGIHIKQNSEIQFFQWDCVEWCYIESVLSYKTNVPYLYINTTQGKEENFNIRGHIITEVEEAIKKAFSDYKKSNPDLLLNKKESIINNEKKEQRSTKKIVFYIVAAVIIKLH
ncbi:MAG: hypothetical protein IJY64_06815 [Bacteroidaceae bacterium]|nr:hypothetical protein [Bacteroidaceae bacterium]